MTISRRATHRCYRLIALLLQQIIVKCTKMANLLNIDLHRHAVCQLKGYMLKTSKIIIRRPASCGLACLCSLDTVMSTRSTEGIPMTIHVIYCAI